MTLVFCLVGCEGKREALPAAAGEGRRSDAVTSSRPVPTPVAAPHAEKREANEPKAPRAFCTEPHRPAGVRLPATRLVQLQAGSRPLPRARPTPPPRHWTWVNLWAAWCGPCKEEIPRLERWERALAATASPVALAFVSLDDDEREAQRFLDTQPPTGLHRSFWLGERERAAWLGTFGLREAPTLPVQLLFDPAGELACIVGGAVEDRDFDAVRKFVGASR